MAVDHDSLKSLPPVTPPSGKFIAQLFLVPGLIVVVAVGILWSFSWLVGASRTPEQFLKDLSNPNLEVRWRAGSDLVQVLKKDPLLASNPRFVLDLSDLLRKSIDEKAQTATKPKTSPVEEDQEQVLKSERFIVYLMSSLGNCTIPAGAPLLCEVATKDWGSTEATGSLRCQLAVWALANLGEQVRHVDKLSSTQREETMAILEGEAQGPDLDRAARARLSVDYLKDRFAGRPRALGVDTVLAQCAKNADPFVRKMTALALSFWEGNQEENERMESALVGLSYDDGHGAADESNLRGLEIRYMAAQGLARRGSLKVKSRLAVLGEMLDEARQRENFRQGAAGTVDESAVVTTLTGGLKATAELRRKCPQLDLSSLQPDVIKLTHNGNAFVRTEAERTLLALNPRQG